MTKRNLPLARPWSAARRPRGCKMTSTRQHLAHLLKYYPRRPCAPSLIKSRFFRSTTIFTYLLLTSLHFWNSLHVYTRGILGCLLGFWPLGQKLSFQKMYRLMGFSFKGRFLKTCQSTYHDLHSLGMPPAQWCVDGVQVFFINATPFIAIISSAFIVILWRYDWSSQSANRAKHMSFHVFTCMFILVVINN